MTPCAIVDGKIILLSKRDIIKRNIQGVSINAIKDGLNSNKLKINDIDLIEVGFLPERYVKEFLNHV